MKERVMLFLVIFLIATGCTSKESSITNEKIVNNNLTQHINLSTVEPVNKTNSVYTVERKLALTFNGLPSSEKLSEVLQKLKEKHIIATFFVPGLRAAEQPQLVIDILNGGHKIENNTLNKKNLTSLTEEEIYKEVSLGKSTLEKITNETVKYLRTETSLYELPILKSAAETNHERYIGYSLFLTDSQLSTKFSNYKDLRIYIQRGAIIAIDLERNNEINKMIDFLVEAVNEVKYNFVTVDDLLLTELEQKPYYEIQGYDLVKHNEVKPNQTYHMFYRGNEQKKHVALTIDDWGTDYTVTTILDILAEKSVIATFYLRANGVQANPSLARAILEEGHEIANHTYSHPVITTITKEQLQEELINAHYALTEALQQPPSMFFRPPTGAINDETAKIVAATGYYDIAMYDVTTLDWNPEVSANEILQIISNKVTNGSIILLHMLDDINTIEALPHVIDFLTEEGYELVTTTEILK